MCKIISLKTEYSVNPIGIETQTPRFSWEYAQCDNLIQISYRIIVASSVALIEHGTGDKWDSGIIFSEKSINVSYKGKQLRSSELCYVKVFAKTTAGDAQSDIATFETGLFEKDRTVAWHACPLTASGAAMCFRRNFTIPELSEGKTIERARAYVCGLGFHELYINGNKVGSAIANPVISDYNKRVYYNIYDVTPFIAEEKNAIGILAGNGWYGEPKITAEFYIAFTDGSEKRIITNKTERLWKARSSPVISGTIFDGETYDARMEEELKGWSGYNESFGLNNGWYFAVWQKNDPEIVMYSQKVPPIIAEEDIPYKEKRVIADGTAYDFGEILTGREVITVKGERGAKVVLKFGERQNDDGTLNYGSLRNAKNTDVYILSGNGKETFAPRFSYRGFRYAFVTVEGKVEILSIKAQRLRMNFERTGKFTCSDKMLEDLHNLSLRTEACNQNGILSDCPQRDERMGWLNDLASRLYQTCNNFDVSLLLEKITDDITDTMDENGAIRDTAPYYLGSKIADPVSVAYLLIAEFAHKRYADNDIIEQNYDNYKKWVEYLLAKTEDGILSKGIYGDWVPAISVVPYISRRFNKGVPVPLISSMYLCWHLKLIEDFAKLTGRTADEKKYSALWTTVKNAVNKRFYDEKNNRYCEDVQSGNAMALSLGIAEKCAKKGLFEAIVKDMEARGYHMTCGNQAYRHLIKVLSENGRNDIVYKLLKNKEYPGWGYMLENGATTVWERWENSISTTEENMHSYCHPMFGSYDYWFYQSLAGINFADDGGYFLKIQPCGLNDVKSFDCELKTGHGTVKVSCDKQRDETVWGITIPSNCRAEVTLPGSGKTETLNSGVYVRRFERKTADKNGIKKP